MTRFRGDQPAPDLTAEALERMGTANTYLLSYLRKFIAEHGYAPSVREVQAHFGWKSPDTAQRRLQSLVDEGRIVRVGPRAIRITDE